MPSIHLLNKATSPLQPVEISPGNCESGLWLVSIERAGSLKGHSIHFHHRKADAAFLSGTVTDYRREPYITPKGNTSPRTIFSFTPSPDSGDARFSSGIISTTDKWGPNAEKRLRNPTKPVNRLRVQDLDDSPIDWLKAPAEPDRCRILSNPRCLVDLLKRVTRVSLETMKIVSALPALNESKEPAP